MNNDEIIIMSFALFVIILLIVATLIAKSIIKQREKTQGIIDLTKEAHRQREEIRLRRVKEKLLTDIKK